MDVTAPHLGFVAASYALTALVLAGLCLSILMRDRALRREAERLDRERQKR